MEQAIFSKLMVAVAALILFILLMGFSSQFKADVLEKDVRIHEERNERLYRELRDALADFSLPVFLGGGFDG